MSDIEETQDNTVEDSPETPLLQEQAQQEEEPQEEVPPKEETQPLSLSAKKQPLEVANDVIVSHVEDASREDVKETNTAKKVYIRVVFMKIGDIDTVKESFVADVFVQARWREPTLDGKENAHQKEAPLAAENYWNPKIVVENAIGDSKESTSTKIVYDSTNGEAFIIERRRVKATFHETMELFNFPFDTQDLTVTLSSELTDGEVQLEDDPNNISTINAGSFTDVQEWKLYNEVQILKGRVIRFQQLDATDARSYSFLSCRTNASRRSGFFLYSIFLTMFFIMSLIFTTFSVEYIKRENRIQMSFVLLLTTVTFKSAVNSSLPRISYLTTLDTYIMSSSLMLILIIIWHAIVIPISGLFGPVFAAVLDFYVLLGFMAVYYLAHIIMLLRIGTRTTNLARKYEHLERKHKEQLRNEKQQKARGNARDTATTTSITIVS